MYVEERSDTTLNEAVKMWYHQCGLEQVSAHNYTKHGFRRGAPQHTFFVGKNRWPLPWIKVWGLKGFRETRQCIGTLLAQRISTESKNPSLPTCESLSSTKEEFKYIMSPSCVL
jgi:hypothetical protein